MYGAIPYLAAAFGVDREEAFRVVCAWVDAELAGMTAPVASESGAASPVSGAKASRRPARKGKASGRRAA